MDEAAVAETADGEAGFCVQANESITRSDIEDAFFFAVGPIGAAAAGKLARRSAPALAFVFAVNPKELAGARIKGGAGASRTCRCVENGGHHQGRALLLM